MKRAQAVSSLLCFGALVACAGQAPITRTAGGLAGSTCSSFAAPELGAATAERLAQAANILAYQSAWRETHPGGALGTLSRAEISAYIRARNDEIRACYEPVLDALPGGRGRVVTRFVIAADGRVPHVSVAASNLQAAPQVGCCLAQRIARWAFPPLTADEFVVVEYPFVVPIAHGE